MKTDNILAVDLATGAVAAALLHSDGSVFTVDDPGKTPHSQTLLPLLKKLLDEARLQWQDIGLFALGAGPGSFTGIRIAAATLAGLNAPFGRPILHLSSLAITAGQTEQSGEVWVIEDARAGDAYVGHYENGTPLEPDRCLRWDAVSELPPVILACHNEPAIDMSGWKRLPLPKLRSEALANLVRSAAEKLDDPSRLPRYPEPAYLQASQAERNAHA